MKDGQKPGAPAAPAASESTALTAKPSAAMLAQMSSGEDTGFEGTSSKDYAIPFVSLLQSLSPQVDKDHAKYVEGAEVGMFYDSSTGELMEELLVVPCHYKNSIVEWKPRDSGGGFVGTHEPGYEMGKPKNDRGIPVTAEGNLLVDTRYYFCLRIDEKTGLTSQCVLSLSSTQLKKSKAWLSRMQAMKMDDGRGGQFTPPMYSHVWRISSVSESNDKGKWKGYKMEIEKPIDSDELFLMAKQARVVFKTTEVKPPMEESGDEIVEEGKEAKM